MSKLVRLKVPARSRRRRVGPGVKEVMPLSGVIWVIIIVGMFEMDTVTESADDKAESTPARLRRGRINNQFSERTRLSK